MNKNTKTALIVALSIFGTGILICLCVSLSVGFNYSKLSFIPGSASITDSSFKAEHIDKDIEEKGQNIEFHLVSSNVTVKPSDDGQIHISYDNTEETYFELKETGSSITLTQRHKGDFVTGFISFSSFDEIQVVLSLPADRDGTLNIGAASSEISISDISMKENMEISSVSGNITIKDCKTARLNANATSGEIELASIETKSIEINTVSGDVSVSDVTPDIPVSIASTSGNVYTEDIKATSFGVETVSGEITLKNTSGQKLSLSTASGGVELSHVDFQNINYSTISGDIRGTVTGSEEDYSVYTNTVSGDNSLSGHRKNGERTLDLSSTSGNFEIEFEN